MSDASSRHFLGRSSTLALAVVTGVLTVTPARAAFEFTGPERVCFAGIAKAGEGLVRSKMKLVVKCKEADLRNDSCPEVDTRKLAALDARLTTILASTCGPLTPADFRRMGFPGPCADPDASDGYTLADLTACMRTVHGRAVDDILHQIYDPTLDMIEPAVVSCERTISSSLSALALKRLRALQRCRQQIIEANLGIWPEHCEADDPRTKDAIGNAEDDFAGRLHRRCTDAQVAALRLCVPDATAIAGAIACLIDQTEISIASVGEVELPTNCGDGIVNAPDEECDGDDDAACPGSCAPAGDPLLQCLCTDRRVQRVVARASGDLDVGATHDGNALGGYVTDLFDCDGPLGPDTVCTVGPSCSLPPHEPCSPGPDEAVSAETLCPGAGNSCRKTAYGATGPHCHLDVQRRCRRDADCPLLDDVCESTAYGPPVPISQGGVSVCVTNTFREDVVGTVDVANGAGAVRLAYRARVQLGANVAQPCPVCGGFCALGGNACNDAGDCAAGPCITLPVCSDGPNRGRYCRRQPPFGAMSRDFGVTSVDCPADGVLAPVGGVSNAAVRDYTIPALSTATTTLAPSVSCAAAAFAGNACLGGTSAGRPCTVASECPAGTCAPQCMCPGQSQPNGCGAACVDGSNDGAPCVADSECPGGFCHTDDCRLNPTDLGSPQEGRCTVPLNVTRHCSIQTFITCDDDTDCLPPECPFCNPDQVCAPLEAIERQCFVSGTIEASGAPGARDRTSAGLFCVDGTGSSAVNAVLGLPSPGRLTQPESWVATGF